MTRMTLFVSAGMILTFSAIAAQPDQSARHATTAAMDVSAQPPTHTAKRQVAFDNLASRDPFGVFMAGNGNLIEGPDTQFGQSTFAAAFTPPANITVTEVKAAVGYIQGAEHSVQIGIYSDTGNGPGNLLWSKTAQLPQQGQCCVLATASDKTGLALTGGTQYWLGVSTLPGGTDTMAGWDYTVADQVDTDLGAFNNGSGWQLFGSLPNFAFAVYGN